MSTRNWIAVLLVAVAIVGVLEYTRSRRDAREGSEPVVSSQLLVASGTGNFSQVVELLERGVRVDAPGPTFGETALIAASRLGHYKIVQILLDHGADVYLTDDYGHNALHWARKNGKERVVELLEAEGATSPTPGAAAMGAA